MKICSGTKRYAIVTGSYTCKVPKLRVRTLLHQSAAAVCNREFLARNKKQRTETYQFIWYMFGECITAGWEKNRTEYKRSNEYAELAVKTLFSFWGIVNVQETAEPCNLSWYAVLEMLQTNLDSITFGLMAPFGHALASRNFGFHQGRFKFVDYGNDKLAAFVFQHRNTFEKALAEFHPTHNA